MYFLEVWRKWFVGNIKPSGSYSCQNEKRIWLVFWVSASLQFRQTPWHSGLVSHESVSNFSLHNMFIISAGIILLITNVQFGVCLVSWWIYTSAEYTMSIVCLCQLQLSLCVVNILSVAAPLYTKVMGVQCLVRLTFQFNHECLREVLHPYCVSEAASLQLYSWSKLQPSIPNLLSFHNWLTWTSCLHGASLLSLLKEEILLQFRKHSGFVSVLISIHKGSLKAAHSGDSTEPMDGLIVCSKLLAIHVCVLWVEQRALCKLQHANASWASFPDSP